MKKQIATETNEIEQPLSSTEATSRNSRRALLLAGTALIATACNPVSGSEDATADENSDGRGDELSLFDADRDLVDDGDGNTEPNNQGLLIAPGEKQEPAESSTTLPIDTTVTTAAVATTLAATSSTTGAPATTAVPTTAVPTTAAPVTAVPTTAVPATAVPTTAAPTTTAPPTTETPPTTVAAPAPPAATARLVTSRLTFGITPEVDGSIVALGIDGWIEDQLAKDVPDPTIESLLADYVTLLATPKQTWDALDLDPNHAREITHSQIVRARYSSHQLFEMMTHTWMDHINVNFTEQSQAYTVDYQENIVRPHAMGRFADLLVASAHSGGMMRYLDNTESDARGGVNENYGRELLELHTLGIDENDNQVYAEADVIGASHVMSGWGVDEDTASATWGQFVYRSDFHSTEAVSLLGGEWTNAGLDDKAAGDSLLLFLARHPSTARHIAYKLCRRFVADEPNASLVDSAAAVYTANDTAIVPVLRHIFTSLDFINSGGDKVRRPFELMAATTRSLGTTVPIDPQSAASEALVDTLDVLGHLPWTWETPDGFPDHADGWVDSTAILLGWRLTSELTLNSLTDPDADGPLLSDIAILRGNATTAAELFERLTFRSNLGELPEALRDELLLLIGAAPGTPANDVTDDNLAELMTFLLAHPLFLLR